MAQQEQLQKKASTTVAGNAFPAWRLGTSVHNNQVEFKTVRYGVNKGFGAKKTTVASN